MNVPRREGPAPTSNLRFQWPRPPVFSPASVVGGPCPSRFLFYWVRRLCAKELGDAGPRSPFTSLQSLVDNRCVPLLPRTCTISFSIASCFFSPTAGLTCRRPLSRRGPPPKQISQRVMKKEDGRVRCGFFIPASNTTRNKRFWSFRPKISRWAGKSPLRARPRGPVGPFPAYLPQSGTAMYLNGNRP